MVYFHASQRIWTRVEVREWAITHFGASGNLRVHFCFPRIGGLCTIFFESEEAAQVALGQTEKRKDPPVFVFPWCPEIQDPPFKDLIPHLLTLPKLLEEYFGLIPNIPQQIWFFVGSTRYFWKHLHHKKQWHLVLWQHQQLLNCPVRRTTLNYSYSKKNMHCSFLEVKKTWWDSLDATTWNWSTTFYNGAANLSLQQSS